MHFSSKNTGWADRLGISHVYDVPPDKTGGGKRTGESMSQLAQHCNSHAELQKLEKFKFESSL